MVALSIQAINIQAPVISQPRTKNQITRNMNGTCLTGCLTLFVVRLVVIGLSQNIVSIKSKSQMAVRFIVLDCVLL
jgi:hypothetical protein